MAFQPTISQVKAVDVVLQNVVRQYRTKRENYVSDQIFPGISVPDKEFKYQVIPRDGFVRDEDTSRAPATESKGGGFIFDEETGSVERQAWHRDVDDETLAREAAAGFPVTSDEIAARYVTDVLLTKRENFFINLAMVSTAAWTNKTSFSASDAKKWSNFSGVNKGVPIDNIEGAVETMLTNTGYMPNTLVLGWKVWRKLKRHPDLLAELGDDTDTPGGLRMEAIAEILGVQRIVLMKASKNTKEEGDTATFELFGAKAALLCYVTDNPGIEEPSCGYTFGWNAPELPDVSGYDLPAMARFYMELKKAWRIEGDMYYGGKVTAPDLGTLWTDAVA